MPLHAIVFGGFSTLAEIDALDHQALDAALQETGEGPLPFADYAALAETPDGPERMERVTDGDGAVLFAAKEEHLRDRVARIGLTPRPGVAEVIDAAQAAGVGLALVTRLEGPTRETMFGGLDRIDAGTFATVAADWNEALAALGERAVDCMAVAAEPETAAAARAAGLPVLAFPGAAHRERGFTEASAVVAALSAEGLGLPRPA